MARWRGISAEQKWRGGETFLSKTEMARSNRDEAFLRSRNGEEQYMVVWRDVSIVDRNGEA